MGGLFVQNGLGATGSYGSANNSCLREANEAEFANVVASLWTVGTIQVGTTTNATGPFSFVNLKFGTYKVRVTAPAGPIPPSRAPIPPAQAIPISMHEAKPI
jgi:hypothetical protein